MVTHEAGMNIEELKQKTLELYDQMHVTEMQYFDLWLKFQLFSWRWWIAVGLIIIPWTVWLIVRKKESTYRLLLVYFFVATLAMELDMIGVSLRLWSYPISIVPQMPCYLPFNYSALPVTTMLFLQFCPNVKPVYKALVYAGLGSFVFQPVMIWVGLVIHEKWPNLYSFPILFLIYLMSHFIATRKHYESVI